MSKAKKLVPGDVVMLRSGGPLMTVAYTLNADQSDNGVDCVSCRWFVGAVLSEYEEFPVTSVVRKGDK